jgi:tetratricopeptide (TPR) repeat protein
MEQNPRIRLFPLHLGARVLLIPALGVGTSLSTSSNRSHNEEAYELYLRAMSDDDSTNSQSSSFSSSNKNAIQLLQRAVALDPGYATAWAGLGHLYYYDSGFGNGGEPATLRAKAALQRAVALDPGRIEAASDLINIELEEGELNRAYDDITNLLHQRPDSGKVHLVHSFVLWQAGLLDESASECEKTRTLDSGTTDLASCGYLFMALGKYDRGREYFQLQSGNEYEKAGAVEIFLREGKEDQALQELKSLPMTTAFYGRPILEPCLQRPTTGKRRCGRATGTFDIDGTPRPISQILPCRMGLLLWSTRSCLPRVAPSHLAKLLRLSRDGNGSSVGQSSCDAGVC